MNKNHGWTPIGKIKLAIFALLFPIAFGTSGSLSSSEWGL